MENKNIVLVVILLIVVGFFAAFGSRVFQRIPVGHVGVATLWGKVIDRSFDEGLHIVNPLYDWHLFDVRQKSHKEVAQVPSQDQLQTTLEVSVQYRIDRAKAMEILKETGDAEAAIQVHLVPTFRSQLREQGKSIENAEDFFKKETQSRLQLDLETSMQEYLAPKGLIIDKVLIRQIDLPDFITRAIEQKKEREQAVQKQKAELDRYRFEQQQKLAQAQAEREAAEEQAKKIKLLADAQAYEIKQVTEAIADNPIYVQLQALKALEQMSKDPATKLYFINGDSPNPLPLMHIGEQASKMATP